MPLPSEYGEYKAKQKSVYMRFQPGENVLRLLQGPIYGWEWWTEEDNGQKKPNRVRTGKELPKGLPTEGNDRPRFFATYVVYNYAASKIQILTIGQSTILEAIDGLEKNKNWGNPLNSYDLTIVRKEKGKGRMARTDYTVQPSPHSPTEQKITEALAKVGKIDLEVLYENGHPISSGTANRESESEEESR